MTMYFGKRQQEIINASTSLKFPYSDQLGTNFAPDPLPFSSLIPVPNSSLNPISTKLS
jgi:hypothetical protein